MDDKLGYVEQIGLEAENQVEQNLVPEGVCVMLQTTAIPPPAICEREVTVRDARP